MGGRSPFPQSDCKFSPQKKMVGCRASPDLPLNGTILWLGFCKASLAPNTFKTFSSTTLELTTSWQDQIKIVLTDLAIRSNPHYKAHDSQTPKELKAY